jgi:hypothetical protein
LAEGYRRYGFAYGDATWRDLWLAVGERLVEIKWSFTKALKDAKINDLRFHDLRHTAATRMGDAGADAFTLAAIFGWSDIRMAMRYTHAMEDSKRRAVEAIAQSQISRDHSVTNENGEHSARRKSLILLVAGGRLELPTLGL